MEDQDRIITLVILAVSGLSTLLQKKRQERGDRQLPGEPNRPVAPTTSRESTPPPSERKPFDLEEQLRRILEGDTPAQPEAPRPRPIQEALPIPPPLPPLAPPPIVCAETEEPAARAMGQLAESAQAYSRAAQLSEAATTRLRQVEAATEHARAAQPAGQRSGRSLAVAAALAQLRTPETVQQAFITATILGPPKALVA